MQVESFSFANLESLESKIDLEIQELGKIKSFEWIISLRQKVKGRRAQGSVPALQGHAEENVPRKTPEIIREVYGMAVCRDPDGFRRWLFMETTQPLVFFHSLLSEGLEKQCLGITILAYPRVALTI